VRTLRGAVHGTIEEILPDGRVRWKPDSTTRPLTALPETLLPE
jgi:hypothetical protein